MIKEIRLQVKKHCPKLYAGLLAVHRCTPRYKKQQQAVRKKLARDRALAQEVFPEFKVAHGPFAGMRYIETADGSALLPKLLGSYEAQLHPWIEQWIEAAPEVIVDVGCAEGYYAVGMASQIPSAKVHAYDISESAREHCSELAALNHCKDRVSVGGYCRHEELNKLLGEGGLLICDIDGAEMNLLDPALTPSLKRTDVLVELHDHLMPGTTRCLLQRFSRSHYIDLVADWPRDPLKYGDWGHSERWAAVTREGRYPSMLWMRMRPVCFSSGT